MPAGGAEAIPDPVLESLTLAQREGFIGSGPLGPHLEHSLGFARAVASVRNAGLGPDDRVVDLGTGGGLPGLVLAATQPSTFTFVEASVRKAAFLREAVRHCGLESRVEVLAVRAEELGRDLDHRARHSIVTARLFGPPAAVAECGSPLLEDGGLLVVSEPPDAGSRWPGAELAKLGLVGLTVTEPAYAVLRRQGPGPERFPRRTGVPWKRPLF